MKKFTLVLLFIATAMLSHAYGFRQGVESSEYDRSKANYKLINCQRLIYEN
jgi:hypothetical protein